MGGEDLRWDAEEGGLRGIRVGHDTSQEVAARARDVGDRIGDETAGAGFGDRDGQFAPEADGLEAFGQADELLAGHRYWCCVFFGPSGGWNSHVSGTPRLPMAPSASPLRVKNVAPDEPVRTSTELVPVKATDLPG